MLVKTSAGMALAAAFAMFAGLGNSVAQAAPEASASARTAPAASSAEADEFNAWRDRFRARAIKAGIPHDVFTKALGNVRPDTTVHEKDSAQPEFNRAIWDYLDGAVSATRVKNGRKMMQRHAAALAQAEKAYGVPRRFLVAIWGMETSYGALLGSHNIFEALATLSYKGDRTEYGEEQLLAALQLLARGEKPLKDMKGSWAGAVGHTQFVPTTYLQYAVDADKDGRRDLWDSLNDVFQSTANYLKQSGFDPNLKWGREAFLPDDFDYALAGYHETRTLGEWRAKGVKMANGALVPDLDIKASVLVPAGHEGPAFLVYENFDAILAYNHSTSYALAIGLLSDQINGGPSLKKSWPRHHRPLALRERVEIQQRLATLGYGPGKADGVLGRETRKAIRAFQKDQGEIADGYASDDLIAKLRAAKPQAKSDEVAEAVDTGETGTDETVLTAAAEDETAETEIAAATETVPTAATTDDGTAAATPASGTEGAVTAASANIVETADPEAVSAPEAQDRAGATVADTSDDSGTAPAPVEESSTAMAPSATAAADDMPPPRSKEGGIGKSEDPAPPEPADPAVLPRAKPAAAVVAASPAATGLPPARTTSRQGGVTAALAAPGLVIVGKGLATAVTGPQSGQPSAEAIAKALSNQPAIAVPVNGASEPIISPPGTVYVGVDENDNIGTEEAEVLPENEPSESTDETPAPAPSGS